MSYHQISSPDGPFFLLVTPHVFIGPRAWETASQKAPRHHRVSPLVPCHKEHFAVIESPQTAHRIWPFSLMNSIGRNFFLIIFMLTPPARRRGRCAPPKWKQLSSRKWLSLSLAVALSLFSFGAVTNYGTLR